jgi:rSAM/selenodomain-associated transferase 2
LQLSIIIPVRNEAQTIVDCLQALQSLRKAGHQIIVVDGGSNDGTRNLANPHCDLLLDSQPGRAKQMNCGAASAAGDLLLFLHADTRLPENALVCLENQTAETDFVWGRFDVQLDASGRLLRIIAWAMNWRSRLTGIATGDQAIFVRRASFESLQGFADIVLMEDVELSGRLRRLARPVCIREQVVVSARRWKQQGVIATVILMWRLRWLYFFGADPERLLQLYYRDRP